MQLASHLRHWRFAAIYLGFLIGVAPCAFLLSFFIVHRNLALSSYPTFGEYIFIATLLWLFVIVWRKEYIIERKTDTLDHIYASWQTVALYTFFIFTYFFLFKKQDYGRLFNTYALSGIFLLSTLLRWAMLRWLGRMRRTGKFVNPSLIIGDAPFAVGLYNFFQSRKELGLDIVGIFADGVPNGAKEDLPFRALSGLKKSVQSGELSVTHIFVCKDMSFPELMEWADFCDTAMIKLRCVVNADILSHIKQAKIVNYHNVPMLLINHSPLDQLPNRFLKRAFDLFVSFLIIALVLSWLIPLVGLFLSLESRGGILFRQKRMGKDGKVFWIFKLRTMRENALADEKIAEKKDPRITRIGALLRRSSLDELPQCINVFLGNMSIVGPRPMPIKETEKFGTQVNKFMTRYIAKPGITGLAQVRGFRGGTGFNQLSGRVRLDRLYIYNWSFLLDLKIIFLTIRSLFSKNEAY